MKQKDIMRTVAASWNMLSDVEKEPFAQMHKNDVIRYENEKKDLETKGFFIDQEGQDSRVLGKKIAAKNAPVKPKRVKSAYMLFVIENQKVLA